MGHLIERALSNEYIRNSLVRSRSAEEFEEIRDNILIELLNDNQRRVNLENIGLAQVEMPQDYNDSYELYRQSMVSYEQCAMSAKRGNSFKIAKSKRSIPEIKNKLSLDSQKFVDCAHAVKPDVLYYQLTSLINHFQVVGDNKSCKAIDKLIKNQGIINRLKSINKTIPIEIINVKDSGYNWSPLHKAAQFGDVEEVKRLITQGIDVNIKTRDGWSPLHIASQYAVNEVVRVLISKGANVHVSSKYGWWSVLHLGSQSGDKEVTRILIEEFKAHHRSVSIKSKGGWTPLHLAVQLGDKGVVELLVREGADVNAPAKGGWRPLHLASRYNNTEVVSLLLEKVSEVNSQVKGHNKWTALHFAAQLGNKEMIRLLRDNGASVDIRDKDGRTAKEIARESCTLKLVDKEITDSSTTTNTIEHSLNCGSFGCKDFTNLRKKRMLERKQKIENIQDDDIKTENRAGLEANQHHKHRHHHGENHNRDEQHINNKHQGHKSLINNEHALQQGLLNADAHHILRGRRDIADKMNVVNDDAVAIGDLDIFSKKLYHDDNLLVLNKDDNDYLLDKQGNLLLLDLLIRKKNGVKYNSQKAMMESKEVEPEYAQSLAYNAYAPPYRAENEEDIELLGIS